MALNTSNLNLNHIALILIFVSDQWIYIVKVLKPAHSGLWIIDFQGHFQHNVLCREGKSWSWSYGSFITTYAISDYHHQHCEFESRLGEVYSIQHYVIKFVSDLRQFGGFLRVLRFPLPKKMKYCWKWL